VTTLRARLRPKLTKRTKGKKRAHPTRANKDNTIPNESREEIKTQEKGKTSASTKENKGVINSLFNISESRSAKQSKRLRQEIIQHKALARQFLYATHRQSEPNKCKTDDGEVKEPKATKKF